MSRVKVSSLSELISAVGTQRIARACGVCHGAVYWWRSKGLPGTHRASMYRSVLSELAGISEEEFARLESGQEIEVAVADKRAA